VTIAMFSGGAASYMACKLVKPEVLLFADTGEEHHDLYKALPIAAKNLGAELVILSGDMDRVIAEHRAIPSPMLPFCSYDLKIKPCFEWLSENAPGSDLIYGFTWDETTRMTKTKQANSKRGFTTLAPLMEAKIGHGQCVDTYIEECGAQSLYERKYPHNNCGGACVKAGISQWKRVLEDDPERFQKWKKREQSISDLHESTHSILKRHGKAYPLTQLQKDVEANMPLPLEEWGGCSCFTGGEA